MTARILHLAALFALGLALAGLPKRRYHPTPAQATPPVREFPIGRSLSLLRAMLSRAISARLLAIASEVAFFALLSLVPALSILVLVYGLVLDRTSLWEHIAPFIALLPDMAREIIRDQTLRLASTPGADLSLNLIGSALLAAWSANAATKALFEAINLQHDAHETRGFVALNLLSLATTLGAVVFVVFAVAVLGVLPLLRNFLPYAVWLDWAASGLRFPVLFASAVAVVAFIYRVALMARHGWRDLLPGALVACVLWTLLSLGFGAYVTRLGNYAATYGSLAAVIVFLTWMWLSVGAILLGASFNASRLERG